MKVFFFTFWFANLVLASSFGTLAETAMFNYLVFLKSLSFLVCVLMFMSNKSQRNSECISLMTFFSIYELFISRIAESPSVLYQVVESLVMVSMAIWVMYRPQVRTDLLVDNGNIFLAFYKGRKGSVIMNFFSLIGLPVKSLSIIAGKDALYLKSKEKHFVFGPSEKFHRKKDEYVFIDTGVKYNLEFLNLMKDKSLVVASKGVFRVRCVEAVRDLLARIGEKWVPTTYIPSLYLMRICDVE